MKIFKSYFGLLLLLIAPFVIYELINGAIDNIDPDGNKEINNPIIWIIIIAIFIPIAAGLVIFGWYAFRGEYDKVPQSSKELKDQDDL